MIDAIKAIGQHFTAVSASQEAEMRKRGIMPVETGSQDDPTEEIQQDDTKEKVSQLLHSLETGKQYPDWNGSPYDRGGADAWYGRPRDPHKYPSGTYKGERVALTDPQEIEAYNTGYDAAEFNGKYS
jgi:hypothetical protein